MMIDDIELRDIFKASSEERLQALDEGLLHLEKHPDDLNAITALMREAHSLKGDGNMLGIVDLGKVAHQIEHVLGAIKRGDQPLSADVFDRLAHGVEAMRQLARAATTGEPAQVEVFYVVAELMGADRAKEDLAPAPNPALEDDVLFGPLIDAGATHLDAALSTVVVAPIIGSNSVSLAEQTAAVAETPKSASEFSARYIADDELRSIFKTSSEERLQALDNGLLHLEKNPYDLAVIEVLMREAHSLKGDSNMLGVGDLGKVAHQIEHILGAVKRGEVELTPDLGDRLAHGIAAMKQLVHEASTGQPTDVNPFYVLATLMGAAPKPVGLPLPSLSEGHDSTTPDSNSVFVEAPQPSSSLAPAGSSPPSPFSCPIPPPDSTDPATAITHASSYRIETIRVPTQSLDALMTQSGELTVTKLRVAHRLVEIDAITDLWENWNRDLSMNRFLFHEVQQGKPVLPQLESFHNRAEQHLEQLGTLVNQLSRALHEDTARLDTITDRLEEGIRTLRLMPLATIFNLFPRLVRDLARQEGKQVELVIEGGDTRADKRILEEMKDPLLHMIYNAIDHGIETPAERRRQGKPEVATITLRGRQTASSIIIEVSDDGRGLNLESIRQAAVRRGLYRPEELEQLTPAQIQGLILSPGFSSRTMVTEISGRGVGLDVLRTNVERLKGTIDVQSTPGQGCTLRVQLGTTLATANVLLVKTSGQTYALPVEFVQTAYLVQPDDLFSLEGHNTILYEHQPISVVWLADLLGLTRAERQGRRLSCIILQAGQERLGIFVDALVDQQDVVLKPQSQLLKRVRYISGATILGTGEVCMVLNPQDLIGAVRQRASHQSVPQGVKTSVARPATARPKRILLVEDSIATRTQEKRILESAGYEVVTAVDGVDGFNKLQLRDFDAVISDVQMPNLDGLGLTQRIRQHREYSELPVVLVTTLASEDDRRRGAEAGANAYIPKGSFSQGILFETLDRLI
jgi:two-component system, chemotaxis family, sensor kinase CheA